MCKNSLLGNKELVTFLNKLFDTNEEFAANRGNDFFTRFQDEQTPYMTILKCSDSRVQMESFDRTPQNGVFAVRNIGNQLKTCAGSIDFGVRVLKTPIFLIIGHSDCGAIKASLSKEQNLPGDISLELANIKLTKKDYNEAIVENVNNQVSLACARYENLINEKKLTIIGAIYDFKNDYGFGRGSIVITNINNITNLKNHPELGNQVNNLKALN